MRLRYTSRVSRIAIGIVAGILTISMFIASKPLGLAIIAAAFVLAVSEFLNMANPPLNRQLSGSIKFVFSASFVTCVGLLLMLSFSPPDRTALLIFYFFTIALSYLLIFFVAAYLMVSNYPDGGFDFGQALYVLFGFGYVFIGLAAFALVFAFDQGYVWFLVLILSWGTDGGAYFTGKTFGKTPLAPNVSPKKTIEGLAGGMLTAAIATPWFMYLNAAKDEQPDVVALLAYAALGAFVAGFGHLGDLTISVIKRQSMRKESGKFLPGHGGVLDKLDSFLLVSVAIAAFYIYGWF